MCESKAGHYKAEKSYFNSFFFCPSAVFRAALSSKSNVGKPPLHWWKCCPHYGSSRGQAMAASIQPASNWLQNDQLPRRKAGEKGLGKIWLLLNSAKP